MDLEGEAEIEPQAQQEGTGDLVGSAHDAAQGQRRAHEVPGLQVVNGSHLFAAYPSAFRLEVERLAADQRAASRGACQRPHRLDHPVRRHASFGQAGELLECQGEQRIAGQDPQGLAELAVGGEPAAAIVVVVHGREVVVDEREGVHALHRHRRGERVEPSPSHRLARGEDEERSHSLAG